VRVLVTGASGHIGSLYSAPSFAALAAANQISASAIEEPGEVESALIFGRPITEIEPFSKPIAMEGT
jgi:hypothetical protein